MENTFQVNEKYALVFGMDWGVLDTLESKSSKLAALKEQGANWIATFKQEGETKIGTIDSIGEFPSKVQVLSGAAQIALHENFASETVLALLKEAGEGGNDGLVVAVGLINGTIILDAVLDDSSVKSAIEEFEKRCSESSAVYRVENVVWEDFLPTKTSRFKTTPAVVVTKLRSKLPANYVAGVIGITAVLAVGYFGYDYYEQQQKRAQELEAARQVDPEVLYAASTKAYLAKPVSLVKNALPAIRTSIGNIPTTFAGWNLKAIQCNDKYCSFRWERLFGTFEEFSDRAPKEWTNIVFSDDARTITTQMAISIPKTTLPPKTSWLTKADFKKDVVSKWQRYSEVGLNTRVAATKLEAVPPGVAPELLRRSPNAINVAQWEVVAGSNWFAADGLDESPDYMTFELFKAVVNATGITFEAKGYVHVKN